MCTAGVSSLSDDHCRLQVHRCTRLDMRYQCTERQ